MIRDACTIPAWNNTQVIGSFDDPVDRMSTAAWAIALGKGVTWDDRAALNGVTR